MTGYDTNVRLNIVKDGRDGMGNRCRKRMKSREKRALLAR